MSRTLNSIADNDTVSTAELLDLIEADVMEGGNNKKSNNNNGGYNRNGSSSGAITRPPRRSNNGSGRGGSGTGRSPSRRGISQEDSNNSILDNNKTIRTTHADPFSVRLTRQKNRRRQRPRKSHSSNTSSIDSSSESDDEEDLSCGGEDEDSVGSMRDFDSYKHSSGSSAILMKHRNSNSPSLLNNHRSSSAAAVGGAHPAVQRQRMPLGGGYGGMFEDDTTVGSTTLANQSKSHRSDGDSTSRGTASFGDDSSLGSGSLGSGSIFSYASKYFTHNKRQHNNPYHSSGNHSVSSRSVQFDRFHNSCLGQMARRYLQLPFRLRYFVQLFSIVGVLMIASLNYFIAIETRNSVLQRIPHSASPMVVSPEDYNSQQYSQYDPYIAEGGGASPNQIPRLRVRDPLKFLHNDLHPNELLEIAKDKVQQSARFGNDLVTRIGSGGDNGKAGAGEGPFVQGWKSMPRQIFNDYATGLSDDTKTIEHSNNVGYFKKLAQEHLGFNSNGNLEPWGKRRDPPKGTVAYVLPITTCYGAERGEKDDDFHPYSPNHPKDEAAFRDFALMLRATVNAHSYRNPASGSVYDYAMVAIVHPRAKKCTDGSTDAVVDRSVVLQNLGYRVSIKNSPIEKENVDHGVDLVRLYAYNLVDYDAVALVDYDTLVLGKLDKAVDLIVDSKKNAAAEGVGDGTGRNDDINSIDAVFSWEHLPSLVDPQARASVINLSFFLLRPSKATFKELVLQYENAPFSETKGWGTIGRGSFPGWTTTQGFLTYYYDEVANAAKIEMNRCAFGNSAEDYNVGGYVLITNSGPVECSADGAASVDDHCDDCSKSKFKDVSVADLSYCRAPWECVGGVDGGGDGENNDASAAATPESLSSGLCRQFQKTWFDGRLQMEDLHPQLEKGNGQLCASGQYQPMTVLKPRVGYRPDLDNYQ